jgi:hypothetical protein
MWWHEDGNGITIDTPRRRLGLRTLHIATDTHADPAMLSRRTFFWAVIVPLGLVFIALAAILATSVVR